MKIKKIFVTLSLILILILSSFSYAEEKNEKNLMAVVTVPTGIIYADKGTRDDEIIYGFTTEAFQSGDLAYLKMPYGVEPTDLKNVTLVDENTALNWKNSVTHQVIGSFADVVSEPQTDSFPPIITLPRGAYLKIGESSEDGRYYEAELFGGVKGWIRKPSVREIRKFDFSNEDLMRKNLVEDVKLYLGTSYRWGGRTPEGLDCSGLTHVVYNLNGLEIYRNAQPKFNFPVALKYENNLKPGDLIFWSGHVGMYIGSNKYVHANGRDFNSVINSFDPNDEDYREDLAQPENICTFGTVFPDKPDELNIKEFYAREFEEDNRTGYKFYVRAEGYTPDEAIIYPEGVDAGKELKINGNDMRKFLYSDRDHENAPKYFYDKAGEYEPEVLLINTAKNIKSKIYKMPSKIKVNVNPLDSSNFVNLAEFIPDLILEIRYYGTYNFVGTRITGYEEPIALLTRPAAEALKKVNDYLISKGYRLKIYDAYRPQMAVNHFAEWAKNIEDTKMKKYFYPDLDKSVLFELGYIDYKSGHSRGSTVDLTLFDMKTEKEADMGGTFDYFGELSHPDYKKITEEQFKNRMILREAMMKFNFRPLSTEWWHFTLNNEPYSDTYFNFPVKGASVSK